MFTGYQRSSYAQDVLSIYNETYTNYYNNLYLTPWRLKHQINVITLCKILESLVPQETAWLDTCCGQAWHFSQFGHLGKKIGVDISPDQIRIASKINPDAMFIVGDVLSVELPLASHNLVTNFWAAYCYLYDEHEIETFVRRAASWVTEGGTLYFEILLPEDIASFNDSIFAIQTGFAVFSRSQGFRQWAYKDVGGVHNMTSPSIDFFTNILGRCFDEIEVFHDGGFMTHLVAKNKVILAAL